MKDRLDALKERMAGSLMHITDLAQLEELRVALLGKKSELSQILKTIGGLPAAERPQAGQTVNEARLFIESRLEEIRNALMEKDRSRRMADEAVDVTMPGKRRAAGSKNPVTIVVDELTELFMGMGFTVAEGPDVELDYYNFEALNIPANHPARDEQQTFYAEGSMVLRTHTSPAQVRVMEKTQPPIKIIVPGTCYRQDNLDSTHSPVFHQMEALLVDRGVTFGDLMGALETMAKHMFGEETAVRFRPHYFPFTEPSAEMDVTCVSCRGKGCGGCKDSGWMELLGCGMVHSNVLRMSGIDPDEFTGWAFGVGTERVAMAKFGITHLRLIFDNDVRFLKQF